jgi:hypothetical protein
MKINWTVSATQLRSDKYTWARLQSSQGKNKAFIYWFDRPSAGQPERAGPANLAGLQRRGPACDAFRRQSRAGTHPQSGPVESTRRVLRMAARRLAP